MEITGKIRQFIEKNLVVFEDEAYFTDDDNIFEMGLVSSLFTMKIINYVERKFDVVVGSEDMEVENFCSINNILRFIESKKNNGKGD